jgi:tellurite resistance protein TerC
MSGKKALARVFLWVAAAMCFNFGIYLTLGEEKALSFLAGYLLEQSLSVDNLFLFLLIFSAFGVKLKYQKRVLTYGLIGAAILRLIFVVLGVAIINRFHWILYIFGLNLIVSGVAMALGKNEEGDFNNNKLIKIIGRFIPVDTSVTGNRFFVRRRGRLHATALFIILVIIEFTDIIFAVDSIPAIFSITTDLFIVYTSNIFAILSLRSMYFVLGRLHDRFRYVKYGVAVLLTLTGVKLLLLMFDISVPINVSLGVIFSVLTVSVLLSLAISKRY